MVKPRDGGREKNKWGLQQWAKKLCELCVSSFIESSRFSKFHVTIARAAAFWPAKTFVCADTNSSMPDGILERA